jgi:hypothetical protein
MLKGIQLQLRAGIRKAVAVPRETIEALDAIEVRVEPAKATFQLTFGIDRRTRILDSFLPTDRPPEQVRVILVVTINGMPDVLIDGLVTHQELNPGNAGAKTTLTVTGEDLTVLMTREELTGAPFAGMEPKSRVERIIGKYAEWGIKPDVVRPTLTVTSSPAQATPQQHGHDLDYLQQLAQRVGHVFYLKTTPQPGTTIAYWGPQVRNGAPQRPINVDFDSHTNADGLSFTFDHTQGEDPQTRVQNPDSKQAEHLPQADSTQVDKPLGKVQPKPYRKPIVNNTANRTASEATMIAQGIATRSADSVTATGKLSVTRYGSLLRPRELVSLRGASTAFNGLWWVDSVTHSITRIEYMQSFTLKRNALVSSIARVAL